MQWHLISANLCTTSSVKPTSPFVFLLAMTGLFYSARRTEVFTFLLVMMVVAPFLTWMTGLVRPVFMARTVLWELFAVVLAMGIAIRHIKLKALAVFVFTVLLALNLKSTVTYFDSTEREDWRGVAELIRSDIDDNDAMLLCPEYVWGPLAYYLEREYEPRNMLGWNPPGQLILHAGDRWDYAGVNTAMTLAEAATAVEHVWVIRSHCLTERGALVLDESIEREAWERFAEWRFPGVHVTRFATPPHGVP